MKEIKCVPKLRFKGFEERWGNINLGELLSFKNGLNADKGKYGKGVKFINVLDIINNDFITYDKIIGKVVVSEKEIEKNEVIYGDILFQRSSETREEVGQANVYLDRQRSCVFGGFVIRGRAKKVYEPVFINNLLKTDLSRKEITTRSGGSTRYNVGQDSLNQVIINLPTLPEQQKIASFLTAVDARIQQLSRKKELLEQYKKGMMQKLFSQELRFKDENGQDFPEWVVKKLGQIVESIKSGKSTNDLEGEIPLYGSTGLIGKCQKASHEGEFILIARVGANAGTLNIAKGKFGVSDNTLIVQCFTNLNLSFLYFYLKFWNLSRLVFGSGQPLITGGQLKSIKLLIPSKNEQQKIANYLSALDAKIEGLTTQINHTQTFKKGLLQQMFV